MLRVQKLVRFIKDWTQINHLTLLQEVEVEEHMYITGKRIEHLQIERGPDFRLFLIILFLKVAKKVKENK